MGALCNYTPYLDYSALIFLSGLYLLLLSIEIYLCQNSFTQILILQGWHHSKATMVIFHKNKKQKEDKMKLENI